MLRILEGAYIRMLDMSSCDLACSVLCVYGSMLLGLTTAAWLPASALTCCSSR